MKKGSFVRGGHSSAGEKLEKNYTEPERSLKRNLEYFILYDVILKEQSETR